MTRIGRKLLLFLPLFFVFRAEAKDLKIDVRPSAQEVSINDTLQVTVTVQSQSSLDDVELNIPDFNNFDVIRNEGPMTSTRSQLVVTPQGQEFQSSYTSTVVLTLAPKKMGEFLFPAFTVTRGGETVSSSTFKVKISPAGAVTPPRQKRGGSPFEDEDAFSQMEDLEDQMMKQLLMQRQRFFGSGGGVVDPQNLQSPPGMVNPKFKNLPKNMNEAFFVQVEVDKVEVYEGEQVTVNWHLLTRGQMETLDRLKFPTLKGFWKEIIEEAPALSFHEEIINGVVFKKALLASHALFPIQSGNVVIDEFKIKSRVRLPAPGLGGFHGNAYEYTRSSPAVTIKAKPLPKEGRPSNFTGAVGNFDVSMRLNQDSILAQQPFQVVLRIEGQGNAKLIELPPMNLPGTLELYETKSEAKFFKDGRSYKEFQLLMIPRAEGSLEIPSIRFSMFDPVSSKYYEKETTPIKISVLPNTQGSQGTQGTVASVGGGDSVPKLEKQKPAELAPSLVLSWDEPFLNSLDEIYQFWGLLFVLAFVVLILRFLFIAEVFGAPLSERDRLLRRFEAVFTLLKKGNYRNAATEAINIYYQALALISDMESHSQDLDGLLERIPPSLRRDHGDRIRENFSKLQALGFAPEESLGNLKSPEELKKNFSEAHALIKKIL